MELGFETKGLRRTCEKDAWARRELGDAAALALQRRLADLEAAETITDLPWNMEFGVNDEGALEFHPEHWLTFQAIRGAADVDTTQEIDWAAVDRIKLTGIRKP